MAIFGSMKPKGMGFNPWKPSEAPDPGYGAMQTDFSAQQQAEKGNGFSTIQRIGAALAAFGGNNGPAQMLMQERMFQRRADLERQQQEADRFAPQKLGDSIVRLNPQTGQYETVYSAPQQPNAFERELEAAGVPREKWAGYYQRKLDNSLNSDPIVTLTLPGNRIYSGPRSGLAAALGGGQGGPAPSNQPPSTLPPDFDFGNGGPTPRASGRFP